MALKEYSYFSLCASVARQRSENITQVQNAVDTALLTFTDINPAKWRAINILDKRQERRINRRLVGDAIPLCESILYISKDMTASHKLVNRQF